MVEKRQLLKIQIIIDDDTNMYHLGEIDGIFSEDQIVGFLESYGEKGKRDLVNHLAFLQFQVIDSWRKNQEKFQCDESEVNRKE